MKNFTLILSKRIAFQICLSLLLFAQVNGQVFYVTNTNDSGTGTLRNAISEANNYSGTSVIKFAIPGTGPHSIRVRSELPDLKQRIGIDGTSQSGYQIGQWPERPQIIVDGALLSSDITDDGLRLTGRGQTVRAIEVKNFPQDGIVCEFGSDILIAKCVIVGNGRLSTSGNGDGIFLGQSTNVRIDSCFIGVTEDAIREGNKDDGIEASSNCKLITIENSVIGANEDEGIYVSGLSQGSILGNYLGFFPYGLNRLLGNGDEGLSIASSSDLKVGMDTRGNTICGNGGHGIALFSNSANISIASNYIGTNEALQLSLGNQRNGIVLQDVSGVDLIENKIFDHGIGLLVRGINDYVFSSQNEYSCVDIALEREGNNSAIHGRPTITGFDNNNIYGSALPNSTVELFRFATRCSQESCLPTEFIQATKADAAGDWSMVITKEGEYLASQTGNGSGSLFSQCFKVDKLVKACRTRDSLVLVEFYLATNGPSTWIQKWDLSQPMDTWYGISLNAEGCVECIDMDGGTRHCYGEFAGGNGLTGVLPPEIGDLSELTDLYLIENSISGEIPEEIGNLTHIDDLHLSFNQFSGNIPASIVNLIQMRELELTGNRLSGTIPNGLGGITGLKDLFLDENNLSGSLPGDIFTLDSLLKLDVSQNNLSGTLPSTISNLSKLQRLVLFDNQFSGELPWDIVDLDSLKRLYLHNNHFEGCWIDDSAQFCSWNQSRDHRVDGYNFSNNPALPWQGDFQRFCNGEDQIGAPCDDGNPNTTNDQIVTDCSCRGSDTTRCRYRDSLALVALYQATDGPNWTEKWDLSAPLNTWYGVFLDQNGCVRCLDLDNNGADCFLANGQIKGNNLTGALPGDIGKLAELQFLSLSGNHLGGEIPIEMYDLQKLEYLYCIDCQWTGILSSQVSKLAGLRYLGLTTNQLEGALPSELFLLPQLKAIGLSSNNLSDQIPKTIQSAVNLESLALHNNNIDGNIPVELGYAKALRIINLSGNRMDGEIPTSMGQLANLVSLYLADNNLEGPLPPEIFDLNNLENLALNDNQFNGTISPNISQLMKLKDIFLSGNNFSGALPVELSELDNVVNLVLSTNDFHGCIPVEYEKFCVVNQFWLSDNPGLSWKGDITPFCNGEDQLEAPCDDGNPDTDNDRIQDINGRCVCQGDRCMTPDVTIDTTICAGDQVILGSQTLDSAGTFNHTFTSSQGCDSTVYLTVRIDAPQAMISGLQVITCMDTIVLASTAHGMGDNLHWTTTNGIITGPTNEVQAKVVSPGDYYLHVQSPRGCMAIDTLTIQGDFAVIEDLSTLEATCPDLDNGSVLDVVIEGGTPPYIYSLDGLQFSPAIEDLPPLSPGLYTLTIRDATGCLSARAFEITGDEHLEVSLTGLPTGEVTPGDTLIIKVVQSSGGNILFYDWTLGSTEGLSCTQCDSVTLIVGGSSDYTLSVEDDEGCLDLVSFTLKIKATGSKDVITPNNDGIQDDLIFEDLDPQRHKDAQLLIVNRWGQVIYKNDHYKNDWPTNDPNAQGLPEGTYYYQIAIDVLKGPYHKGSLLLLR